MTTPLPTRLLIQRSMIQRLNNPSTSRRHRLQKGFTLIELLVVVVILGVLAAIAIPALLNQQGRARIQAAQTAAIDAARACAAAQVTEEIALYALPGNITASAAAPGCPASGTAGTFTATAAAFNLTTGADPVATVAANGQVSLTTCAAASGWTAGTAPTCAPTRT